MAAKSKRMKPGIMPPANEPVYPIGVAARMLGVHPRTLRIYESEGLIRPRYKGGRRLFSQNDIQWTSCLRSMIHDDGISIPGIKKLLALVPCWEITECPPEIHENCEAKMDLRSSSLRCSKSEDELDVETSKEPYVTN